MIITVPKKVVKDVEFGSLITPDTDAKWWQKISETETTMTIGIMDEEINTIEGS